jgi:ubiquinone/menaquinone biosynthesis C-methylase UbiE
MGILKDFNELKDNYTAILKEARRVLKFNGVLVFKCQDFTDSKTTMTHSYVYNWAVTQGFYAKDLAILVRPNKVCNTNTVRGTCARYIHIFGFLKEEKCRGDLN